MSFDSSSCLEGFIGSYVGLIIVFYIVRLHFHPTSPGTRESFQCFQYFLHAIRFFGILTSCSILQEDEAVASTPHPLDAVLHRIPDAKPQKLRLLRIPPALHHNRSGDSHAGRGVRWPIHC